VATAVMVQPVVIDRSFPTSERLDRTTVALVLRRQSQLLFSGSLARGQTASFSGGSITLEGVRYWAFFRLVRERGGALLTLGFLLAITGLVWRLLFFRRELGLVWDDRRVVLMGPKRVFLKQFSDEMQTIRQLLSPEEKNG